MLDNSAIQVLIGSAATAIVTYLGKILITRREQYKFNNEQLESNSKVLITHTKIIADLQDLITKMEVSADLMRDKMAQLRADNEILRTQINEMSKALIQNKNI